MVILYVFIALLTILGIFILKSNRLMSLLSKINAALFLAITLYSLIYIALPSYYLKNQFFFMDALNLYEVLIASFIFFLAAIYAEGYIKGLCEAGTMNRKNTMLFYISFNMLLLSITLSFFSNNLALFWIFLELTTLFSALLIVAINSKTNIIAALNYIFIASTSMLFSFIGLILLFAASKHTLGVGTLNWNILMQNASNLPSSITLLAFIFVFVGFAAKAGIAPFHTWLPFAHAKAPSVVSAILSGTLLNVGIYGILRVYAITHQTSIAHTVSIILISFGVLTIGISAFSMLVRKNLKKFIAYSSIEHMGIMLLGIGIGTPIAIFWVLFHTLAHSLTKALLFFSAGILHHQYGSTSMRDIKEPLKLQTLAAIGFIVGSLAIIGVPLFPIFFSKLFILIQVAKVSSILLFVILFLLLIVAGAFAYHIITITTQKSTGETIKSHHIPLSMKMPVIFLIIILIVLGTYFPESLKLLLDTIVKSVGL
jgi:hydrogenase-4 component F